MHHIGTKPAKPTDTEERRVLKALCVVMGHLGGLQFTGLNYVQLKATDCAFNKEAVRRGVEVEMESSYRFWYTPHDMCTFLGRTLCPSFFPNHII